MEHLFNWIKTRQRELYHLMELEINEKSLLIPKLNRLNETLFLYRYEDSLLKDLEQLTSLFYFINSESKNENYDFFTYVARVLQNIRTNIKLLESNLYLREFYDYITYLQSVIAELERSLNTIEQVMQKKYDSYLVSLNNINNQSTVEYSWSNIAEKFSIKCSGHLERLSLLQAYEQDWKICKTCHSFICPTCAVNLDACPNLARNKHKLELIGLPLENLINFLRIDQKNKPDDNFIRMENQNF
jgi:hypothetical protein